MVFTNFSGKKVRIISMTVVGIILFSFLAILISYTVYGDQHRSPLLVVLSSITGCICCAFLIWLLVFTKRRISTIDRELIENKERYQSIIEASNTGAWEYHTDTHYLWCSPEYFRMLGYDSKEFLQENRMTIEDIWTKLLHPDDKEAAIKNFNDYLSNGSRGLYQGYFRMQHKNGNWVWMWSRGKTLRGTDLRPTNITLGTHIDVTEKRNLEIELMKLNEKLLRYAHLNAHEVRGPVARLLGLMEVLRLEGKVDYNWFFNQVNTEAKDIDKILSAITEELNDMEEWKTK